VLSSAVTYRNKKILIAPLDWGLGHVTRCIPLIKFLQSQGNSITVAGNKSQRNFLEGELEGVSYAELPGYKIRYSDKSPLWMMIALQYPRLRATVRMENKWLNEYLRKNQTDVVISDNRYGLYNKHVETVFITHQLFIRTTLFAGWIERINHNFITKFNHCWVPDFESAERSLSGALSHGSHKLQHVKYIGPLSRFAEGSIHTDKNRGVLLFLSGPEPQRTLLEEKLTDILSNCGSEIFLVRGTLHKKSFPENFTVINIAHSSQVRDVLSSASAIICRPGYSTLMDLHALGKKAFLIPTPGQTEQEYLAAYWRHTFGFETANQNTLSKDSLLDFIREKKFIQLIADPL
jgi:uncharacterized protein (TIGR00661 family)